MAGVVAELGENVKDRGLKVGDHVVCGIDIVCGKCDLCRMGRENRCRERVRVGFERDGSTRQDLRDSITLVESGVFDFHIDGETRRVRAGDSMFVPGGTVHGCNCLEKGAVLDIYAPMRTDFVE